MAPGPEAQPALEQAEDPSALARQLRVLSNAKRIRVLRFLVQPRTLDHVAKELGMARQTAHDHLQHLVAIGAARRLRRDVKGAPVMEFVAVPQTLFTLQEEFARMGQLEVEGSAPMVTRSLPAPPRAAGERDLPRLLLVRGMGVGKVEALQGGGPWLIGREAQAALCLDYDPFVSARHAEVRRAGAGFEVADLYSSNGTFLDFDRLPRGEARRLVNGAVVGAGRTLLVFRGPG